MVENPLASLGDLTKPATVLIEKISDAVGGVFRPYQTVRVVRSQAEAERIRAESQIEVTDLHRRAMHRFLEEEAKRQTNIEDITEKALPFLAEESSPQDVEDDWITNFFDKCRIVSDEDMQRLWASVLSGEANSPGAFSKRTVNLLADLDKKDAELFTQLCGFGWFFGHVVLLVFDYHDEVYKRNEISFNSLSHLESLGLIQFNHRPDTAGFRRTNLPKKVIVFYDGRSLALTLPKEADNDLDVGQVLLTREGQELAPVCGSTPVPGIYDYVNDKFAERSLVPKKEDALRDTPDA